MSLIGKGELKLSCDVCGQEHEIKCNALFFEEVDKEEKEDGTETLYQAEYDFVCEGCDSEIVVTYEVWEYPDNVKENEKITTNNATVIKGCEFVPDEE